MIFPVVATLSLVAAVVLRRSDWVAGRLSVAATTLLAIAGGCIPGIVAMEAVAGPWRWPVTLVSALGGAVALVHLGAWINRVLLDRLRRRVDRQRDQPTAFERLHAFARRHPLRVARVNLPAVTVATAARVGEVRVTGLAAEMTYYGLISLVPLSTAVGASLGFFGRLIGTEEVDQIEATVVEVISQVFAEQIAQDVLGPLVESLLRQERTGIAIGSALVALWLASRVFRAAVRALDDAYGVARRRRLVPQTVLGLALALGAVVTFIVLVALIVVGPMFGGTQEIADRFGLGGFFEVAWAVLRWPAVGALTAGYLTILYRYGPNTSTTWRRCLTGAVLGTIALVVVALGFSLYLEIAGPRAPEVGTQDEAVLVAAQIIGVVLAGVLWLWLSSIVILVGGVLNAEIERDLAGATDLDSERRGGRRWADPDAGASDSTDSDAADPIDDGEQTGTGDGPPVHTGGEKAGIGRRSR